MKTYIIKGIAYVATTLQDALVLSLRDSRR